MSAAVRGFLSNFAVNYTNLKQQIMYDHQGLSNAFFLMLYGAAAWFALLACVYLLWRCGNAFMQEDPPEERKTRRLGLRIRSSLLIRRWTAAFMLAIVGSHVWWYVIGVYWLADDRLVRNIVCITLDRLTFVPLMMCLLLRMLQDQRRPLWPVWMAMAPMAILAVISIAMRNDEFEQTVVIYMATVTVVFLVYYVLAVRKYGRWLCDNFADLENKELWQSLLLLAFILFVHVAYSINGGALMTEYLAQVNTLVIIAFLLWRVETLQELNEEE